MKKVSILILAFMLLLSCGDNSSIPKSHTKETDSTYQLRYIMRDNHSCQLDIDSFELLEEHLLGQWVDSITWQNKNLCWYGIEELERTIKFEFYPSGKYILEEDYKNPNLDFREQGEYSIFNHNDSNFLFLDHNGNGDTLFNQGDTMITRKYMVYSSGSKNLRVRLYNYTRKHFGTEIIDLKRK